MDKDPLKPYRQTIIAAALEALQNVLNDTTIEVGSGDRVQKAFAEEFAKTLELHGSMGYWTPQGKEISDG